MHIPLILAFLLLRIYYSKLLAQVNTHDSHSDRPGSGSKRATERKPLSVCFKSGQIPQLSLSLSLFVKSAQYRPANKEITKRRAQAIKKNRKHGTKSQKSKPTSNSSIIHPPMVSSLFFRMSTQRNPSRRAIQLYYYYYSYVCYIIKILPMLLENIMSILNMRKKLSLTQGHTGNTQQRQYWTLSLQILSSVFCPYTTIYHLQYISFNRKHKGPEKAELN